MAVPSRIIPTPLLAIVASITIILSGVMTLLPTAHGHMTPSMAIGPTISETLVIHI